MSSTQLPQVGVGVAIFKDNKVLLGKRLPEKLWGMPGGHLDYLEKPEEAAIREVKEETGIILAKVNFWTISNDIFPDNTHYVTLWYYAATSIEPKNLEPHKCAEWKWFVWNDLPENLFLSDKNLHASKPTLPKL